MKPFESSIERLVEENSDETDPSSTDSLRQTSNDEGRSYTVKDVKVGSSERMNRERRILLTRSESLELERIVSSIAAETGTTVKTSHILRSCIAILMAYEMQIVGEAKQAGQLVRPANQNYNAIQEFESNLADIIIRAIRA